MDTGVLQFCIAAHFDRWYCAILQFVSTPRVVSLDLGTPDVARVFDLKIEDLKVILYSRLRKFLKFKPHHFSQSRLLRISNIILHIVSKSAATLIRTNFINKSFFFFLRFLTSMSWGKQVLLEVHLLRSLGWLWYVSVSGSVPVSVPVTHFSLLLDRIRVLSRFRAE